MPRTQPASLLNGLAARVKKSISKPQMSIEDIKKNLEILEKHVTSDSYHYGVSESELLAALSRKGVPANTFTHESFGKMKGSVVEIGEVQTQQRKASAGKTSLKVQITHDSIPVVQYNLKECTAKYGRTKHTTMYGYGKKDEKKAYNFDKISTAFLDSPSESNDEISTKDTVNDMQNAIKDRFYNKYRAQ